MAVLFAPRCPRVVVITTPDVAADRAARAQEVALMRRLIDAGLPALHLRKPDATEEEVLGRAGANSGTITPPFHHAPSVHAPHVHASPTLCARRLGS
jgi:hypothetical protein